MLEVYDMSFKVIQGQGQGQEMTSVPYRDYFIAFMSGVVVVFETETLDFQESVCRRNLVFFPVKFNSFHSRR